jgi:xanthine/uracil permease
MRFWLRELAGWLLVLLGLYLFLHCVDLLLNARWILEPIPVMVIGIVVFRGGIHLLKVAIAARICESRGQGAGGRGQEAKVMRYVDEDD